MPVRIFRRSVVGVLMLSYSGESVQQAHQRPFAGPHRHICRGSQSGLRKAVCALRRRVFGRHPASHAGRHAADATIGPSLPSNPQSAAHHRRPRRFRHHRRRSHSRSPPVSAYPVSVTWLLMMTKLGPQDSRDIVRVGEIWKRVTTKTV